MFRLKCATILESWPRTCGDRTMRQAGLVFPIIFWIFNRVELVCAAVALSSIWAWSKESVLSVDRKQQLFAGAAI